MLCTRQPLDALFEAGMQGGTRALSPVRLQAHEGAGERRTLSAHGDETVSLEFLLNAQAPQALRIEEEEPQRGDAALQVPRLAVSDFVQQDRLELRLARISEPMDRSRFFSSATARAPRSPRRAFFRRTRPARRGTD
jgi:hypothetical protein